MKKSITISVAALAFGAVLAAAPAFAQQAQSHYGRAVDDGGAVDAPSAPAAQPLYNSVPQQTPSTAHNGRALNDGGTPDQPTAAQLAAEKAQNKVVQQKSAQSAPNYGRAPNDGGM
jgi:hypothetical protein